MPPPGRARLDPGARDADLGGTRHRHRRAAGRDRPLPALPRRGAAGQGARRRRQGSARSPRPGWAAAGAGLQDHRGPVRRPADLLPRLLAARSGRTTTSGTPNRGEEERIGQVLRVHGKDTRAGGDIAAGEIGAVAKLVHTVHGRHAVVARAAAHACRRIDFPQPHRCRSRSSRRPRPTWTRWAPRSPGSSRKTRASGSSARPRPASSSSGRRARATSP